MTNNPALSQRSLTIEGVKQLCVVGAGTVGAQIAQVAALSGFKVNLTDPSQAALDRGIEANRNQLQLRVKKGKLTQEEADAALARVTPLTSLEEAAGAADFVIEASCDDLEAKRKLFRRLDGICPPHTILASNSPNIVISKFTANVARKDKVCNMHFFHPALVMQLVEVVPGPETSDETIELVTGLGHRIGKEVVVMQKEVFGFIANSNLFSDFDSPWNLNEGSHAPVEDTLKPGLNHSMKSFELAGFSSGDVVHFVKQPRYKETGDPRDKPPAFLEEMVKEGLWGRKTGQSFYGYTSK